MGDDNRNMFIAFGLMILILLGYQVFVLGPAEERRRAAEEAQRAAQEQVDGNYDETLGAVGEVAEESISRDEALAQAERIEIDAPGVVGSLSLSGATFDDLRLRRHFAEVGSDELVSLLNPRNADHAFMINDGWRSTNDQLTDLPGNTTLWSHVSGDRLTPDTPIVLAYESESGLNFQRRIEVDDNYLFTVTDTITNTSGNDIGLSRYGLVRHAGLPDDLNNNMVVFEGGLAMVDGRLERRKFQKYDDLVDPPCLDAPCDANFDRMRGEGGWVGITQRYWMAAAIPEQGREITAIFDGTERGETDDYIANYSEAPEILRAGATRVSTAHVYAGAKELDVLRHVQTEIGVARFDSAINWGWLWFLVKPFVWLLTLLNGMTGHFGLAILALTLIIKIVMFPLANRAYASMAKMKAVAPKMQEIKERYANDVQKQQQETMELYKREKINPLAGCIPILPQIPIFFALYQTLFNAIEMRHQPFYGWISDMSAADPTNIWNIFGLLPYDPSNIWLIGGILGIGAWPIIMGLTMAAQQALNPPPPDPMQARIFAMLPIIFTFILAPFAAGLVIYWAWNNFLTVLQQYVIMRRHGNETQLDKLVVRIRDKLMGSKSGDES